MESVCITDNLGKGDAILIVYLQEHTPQAFARRILGGISEILVSESTRGNNTSSSHNNCYARSPCTLHYFFGTTCV